MQTTQFYENNCFPKQSLIVVLFYIFPNNLNVQLNRSQLDSQNCFLYLLWSDILFGRSIWWNMDSHCCVVLKGETFLSFPIIFAIPLWLYIPNGKSFFFFSLIETICKGQALTISISMNWYFPHGWFCNMSRHLSFIKHSCSELWRSCKRWHISLYNVKTNYILNGSHEKHFKFWKNVTSLVED